MNGIRKHRGLRRYYKNLETKTSDWSGLNFTDPELAWFDLWHTHFDWKGFGNNSFKSRKPHLDKLFRHLTLLTQKATSLSTPYQIWATILDFDSGSDALYLHTPNPNQDNFPHHFKDLQAENSLTNTELKTYLDGLEGYEKRYGIADEAFCVLYKKDSGLNPHI